MPGNETLGTVNHCYAIVRYPMGVMYYSSAPGAAMSRFKFRGDKFVEFEKSIPEGGANLSGSRPAVEFPNFSSFNNRLQLIGNLPQPIFPDSEKPPYSNVSDSIADELYYYSVVDRYIRFMKPVYVVETGVFRAPGQEFFYGKPMHCHNFIMQVLGLQIGNIITSLHFKNRLIEWSGKTNFFAELIYEQPPVVEENE